MMGTENKRVMVVMREATADIVRVTRGIVISSSSSLSVVDDDFSVEIIALECS